MSSLKQYILSGHRSAHLGMILYTLIIAGSFPVVEAITTGIDSMVLTFWRFLAATLVFAAMLPFRKDTRLPGFRDMVRYIVVGGSYGLYFILMFEALKETSAINTSTIFTMLPLLTMLLGGALGDPIRVRQLGILSLSMAAALWVIFRGNVDNLLVLQFSRGDLIFFVGVISLAVYMLALKKLARDESKVCFTFYSLLVATIILLITSWWRLGTLPLPSAGTWLGLTYLSVLSTAVTFWILQLAAVRIGPNHVVAYTFLTPSAVAAIQWILGLSPIELPVLPGIGVTLLVVWLLQCDRITGNSNGKQEMQ